MGVAASGSPDRGAGQQVMADDRSAREARLAELLRAWWRDDRPAWTELSWWDATLHDDARRLLWLPPGPELLTALEELAPRRSCPVLHTDDRMLPGWPMPGRAPGWPCACQVVTAAAWEACASWLTARSAAALVTAAGPEEVSFDVGDGLQRIHDPAREELAHALRTSIPAMGNRIGTARALRAHPRLVELVESGAISAWAGRLVLDHVADLQDEESDRVIEEVAARVHQRLATERRPYHSAEINRLARAARLRICPETAREGRVRAFSARRVTVQPTGNGMATLIAEVADVDAHRIHRRLTAIAAGVQSDAAADGDHELRTRDQLRADVLVDLLLGPRPTSECAPAADGSQQPELARTVAPRTGALQDAGGAMPGSRPEIQVIVTLSTLLGLTDDPAEVPGLGPVPAEVARTLAADGTWRAWIADASGAIACTGSRGYVPSAALARLVRAREPHCRFPGCRQPATRCDLDHAVPWPRGSTSPENLGPLCRRHHNFKTHSPWHLDAHPPRSPGGSPTSGWRWRTPAGFTIDDHPESPLGTSAELTAGQDVSTTTV